MERGFIAKAEVSIHAPVSLVWDALTNPDLVKQYLFGTEMITDGKVGSAITYKGVWQGKTYEDKGKILQIIPEKLFQSTYWSSMSGLKDSPENYATVTYMLTVDGDMTILTLTQDNNPTEESKAHSEQNWKTVLDGLKKLLEK